MAAVLVKTVTKKIEVFLEGRDFFINTYLQMLLRKFELFSIPSMVTNKPIVEQAAV